MLPFLLIFVPVKLWFGWVAAAVIAIGCIDINSESSNNKVSLPGAISTAAVFRAPDENSPQYRSNEAFSWLWSSDDKYCNFGSKRNNDMVTNDEGAVSGTAEKRRVKVDVFIESLCIDSKEFVLNVLLPTYQQLGPSIMDLSVISFGNAKYVDNATTTGTQLLVRRAEPIHNQQLVCQHGVAECDANAYILCVADAYKQNIDRYLPFIACLFETLPMGYHSVPYETQYFASCSRHAGLDWTTSVKNCHNDQKRVDQLQYYAYQQTLPTNHTYVPWIQLNNNYWNETSSTSLTFRDVICTLYNQTTSYI